MPVDLFVSISQTKPSSQRGIGISAVFKLVGCFATQMEGRWGLWSETSARKPLPTHCLKPNATAWIDVSSQYACAADVEAGPFFLLPHIYNTWYKCRPMSAPHRCIYTVQPSHTHNLYPSMISNSSCQPVVINHKSITVATILPTHQHATSIILEHCTSREWKKVGKALASLQELQALALLHCNTSYVLCHEMSQSKSLLRLRIGTCLCNAEHCGVTEKGV